jgi:hypothetical protein
MRRLPYFLHRGHGKTCHCPFPSRISCAVLSIHFHRTSPCAPPLICPLAHTDTGRHNHVTTFPANIRAITPTVTRTQVKTLQATSCSCTKQYSNQSGLNGIQLWGTASTSNIAILECFQSKALRMTADVPCYVPNMVIPRDLQTPTVKEEIRSYSSQYSARLNAHPNDLIVNRMELPDNRRLRRHLQMICLPDS